MPSDVRWRAGTGWAFSLFLGVCVARSACAASLCPDYDGDTVCDADEDLNGDGDPSDDDTDGDQIANGQDPDDDGDGFFTVDEDANEDHDPTNDFNDILGREKGPDYLNRYVPLDRDRDEHVAEAYGGDDCDDERFGIHPGVEHDPFYDGQNWDCDDQAFEYDQDFDGYESATEIDGGDDCNDYEAVIHPGAIEGTEPVELGDVDIDCDGWTDIPGTLVPNGGCDCDSSPIPGFGLLVALGAVRRRR